MGEDGYSNKSSRWNVHVPTAAGYFVDQAIRAGVSIYTIDASPLDSLLPGADFDVMADYKTQAGARGWITPQGASQRPQLYQRQALDMMYLKRAGLQDLANGTGGLMISETNDISVGHIALPR